MRVEKDMEHKNQGYTTNDKVPWEQHHGTETQKTTHCWDPPKGS